MSAISRREKKTRFATGEVVPVVLDVEARRQRQDVLEVAADVEDETHERLAPREPSGQALEEHAIGQLAIRRASVLAANLHAQREAHAVRVADDLRVAPL